MQQVGVAFPSLDLRGSRARRAVRRQMAAHVSDVERRSAAGAPVQHLEPAKKPLASTHYGRRRSRRGEFGLPALPSRSPWDGEKPLWTGEVAFGASLGFEA